MPPIKAILVSTVALAITAGLTGCGEILNNPAQAQPKSQEQAQPCTSKIVHHFEPVQRFAGIAAIDTATGRMCRTRELVCRYNPRTVIDNCPTLAALPSCDEVANK
jgi:hypothetical protein